MVNFLKDVRNKIFGKQKVTLDTSVIISDIVFDSEVAKEAVEKSTTEDEMMFTSIIFDECMNFTDSKKNRKSMTRDEMEDELIKRFGIPMEIKIPPIEELKGRFQIRDEEDLKILHSAERTRSKLIVTRDDDLLDPNLKGLRYTKVVEMYEYVGKKRPKK